MKREDIEHLATLARIELREGEAEHLATEIEAVLEYVSEINEITADTIGEKKVGVLYNVMREDGNPHEGGIYTEKLLKAAPERSGKYIKVKKILGGQ